MATLEQTIADLVRANKALDIAADQAESLLLRAFRRAEAQAFRRIAELMVEAPNFSTTDLTNRLAWYFQNIPSLQIAGSQAAYGEAVVSYLDDYPRLGELASKILSSVNIPKDLTLIPDELIRALQGRDSDWFNVLNTDALARLDRQLLDSVVVGRTPANALSSIKGTITGSYPWGKTRGLYEWHAGTYARTAAMRFSRQILKDQANELNLETFVYVGPVDAKTRPFCLELAGGAFTREEIEDFDNGQTGDTFSDGGGFNCRHTWSPVPRDVYNELKEQPNEGQDIVNKEITEQKLPLAETLQPKGQGAV